MCGRRNENGLLVGVNNASRLGFRRLFDVFFLGEIDGDFASALRVRIVCADFRGDNYHVIGDFPALGLYNHVRGVVRFGVKPQIVLKRPCRQSVVLNVVFSAFDDVTVNVVNSVRRFFLLFFAEFRLRKNAFFHKFVFDILEIGNRFGF